MPFNKILVAYDGSKPARDALDKAVALLACNPSAKLEVVHVVQLPNMVISEAVIATPPAVRNDYYDASEKMLAEAKARLASLPDPPKVTMLEGGAAEAIVSYAEHGRFDLIVIGNRGLGGIREFFMGSVSHNVAQHAKMPVLIVK